MGIYFHSLSQSSRDQTSYTLLDGLSGKLGALRCEPEEKALHSLCLETGAIRSWKERPLEGLVVLEDDARFISQSGSSSSSDQLVKTVSGGVLSEGLPNVDCDQRHIGTVHDIGI